MVTYLTPEEAAEFRTWGENCGYLFYIANINLPALLGTKNGKHGLSQYRTTLKKPCEEVD